MTVLEAKQENPQSDEAGLAVRRQNGRSIVFRPLLDACTAFALFVMVSLALSSGPTSAGPLSQLIQGPATMDSDTTATWLLLSFAFSVLAALNMALVRHLRHAYANPRKRS